MSRPLIKHWVCRAALAAWLVVLMASCGSVRAPSAALVPPLVITPMSLDESTADQANPLRGLYRWSGQEVAPLAQPALDSYQRYTWRDLEPARDQYDFSILERELAEASSRGQRHAFRIRAMVNNRGLAVPDYLPELMPQGWWGDADGNGKDDTYIPDWNDPYFQERLARLIAELGRRYNGDPRIAWVDVGFYGNWGEWHMWPFQQEYPRPEGAEQATSASKQKIIVLMANAFVDTQLLMASEDNVSLSYALRTYPRMGWRRDSLGDTHFTEGAGFRRLRENPEDWALFTSRWKTAPVVTEFISPNDQQDPMVYQLALQQAADYHVSLVSNGNTLEWKSLSPAGQSAFLSLGRSVGYRYTLNQLSLPSALHPEQAFSIQSLWSNDGNAPTYERWQVTFQLRSAANGQIVWQGTSALDMRNILPYQSSATTLPEPTVTAKPTAAAEPLSLAWKDSFMLPTNVAPGSYTLSMQVVDPARYRTAMQLSITGGQADHSYILGTVTIVRP